TDSRSSGPPRLKSTIAVCGVMVSNCSRENRFVGVTPKIPIEVHADAPNKQPALRRDFQGIGRQGEETVRDRAVRRAHRVDFGSEVAVELDAKSGLDSAAVNDEVAHELR